MISYDDFAKLDIRIGEILMVEVVENTDKLLRLTVDLGEGMDSNGVAVRRQIVSGIREYFDDPQTLIGRKCPFLINLEHRTICGIESQGMILAASSEDNTFGLLELHVDLPAGARIK